MRVWRWIAGLALAWFALGAAATAIAADQPLVGAAAPDFALRAFAGPNVRLSEGRGDVVVLVFWGSGCDCRPQLSMLDRSYTLYRAAGLQMFGVGVDDNAAHAREYADGARVQFPLLSDPEKAVARLYQVDVLPMTVLIDRTGVVRHVLKDAGAEGAQAQYLSRLRELLNE